ncbi:subtilisin-like protein [Fomes fomentarius]|nr:subtilisin-like protein [Fomes fomentarius]
MVVLPLSLFISLTSAIATFAGASSPPRLSRRVLHERRNALPSGWTLHRRADPDVIVPLSIALRQSNLENLDGYLFDVADPSSPNYGQLWTASRVAKTFRPSKESIDAVHSWLVDDGMEMSRFRLSKDGGYVHLNVSVSEAERLLAAEYYVYKHADSGVEHVGCHRGYHLPEHITAHVDLITPTVEFGGVQLGAQIAKRSSARAATPAADSSDKGHMYKPNGPPKQTVPWKDMFNDTDHCDTQAVLDCFRALYDFYPNLTATDKNTVGVVELADQTLNPDDLQLFFQKFAPELVGTVPTLVSIDGGVINASETDPNLIGESNLDFQLIMGLLGKQQEVKLYQVGGSGSFNLLLDAIDTTTPDTFCNFDGGDDPDFDFVFPDFYMQRQCTEYGKLGLMGMTFLYASGDNGVASNAENLCLAANGSTVVGEGNFLPNFPATCPYVTAVGATQVDPGKSVRSADTPPLSVSVSVSISLTFLHIQVHDPRALQRASAPEVVSPTSSPTAVPEPRRGQVPQALRPDLGPDVFNRTGRGVPDLSANGFPTAVVIDKNLTLSGGTSASTPIVAAMIVAINDARLAAGKNPVGWINPAIYSHMFASAFNDIKNGSNPGCGTDGFPTARGWDPVTGLGTPRFRQLLQRFLALP